MDRSTPVAVGLVGLGRIARMFHARILRDLREATLAAIVDSDDERLREAERIAPEADAMRDYDHLLSRDDIAAVVLCLPTGMHAEAAVAAFRQGKHVYVEKPLATTLEDGRRVVAAWRESGRVGAIGFNTRLHPLYREAREVLTSGRLGAPIAVRGVFSSAPRELPAWKRHRVSGGGALLDLASHQIDRVQFLLGDRVEEVIATIRSVRTEEDTALITLTLQGGTGVQLLVTNNGAEEDCLEIYGEAGKLVIDRFRSRRLEHVPLERPSTRTARLSAGMRDLRAGVARARETLLPSSEPSFRESLRAFALAVQGRGQVAADILDGYRNLEAVVAAETSAATGVPVRLTQAD